MLSKTTGTLIKLVKDENDSVQVFKYLPEEDCYNVTTDINGSLENRMCILLDVDKESSNYFKCLIDNSLYIVNIKNISFDV